MITGFLRALYEQNAGLVAPSPRRLGVGLCVIYRKFVFPDTARCHAHPHGFGRAFESLALCADLHFGLGFGALLGYAIGYVFWETVGQPIVAFYNGEAAFERFVVFYDDWGIWIVLAAAISFLPFKVATIASGVSGLALAPFLVTSLIGRAIRFFGIAALVYYFGPDIQKFIDRYFNILSLLFVALLVLAIGLLGAF